MMRVNEAGCEYENQTVTSGDKVEMKNSRFLSAVVALTGILTLWLTIDCLAADEAERQVWQFRNAGEAMA